MAESKKHTADPKQSFKNEVDELFQYPVNGLRLVDYEKLMELIDKM